MYVNVHMYPSFAVLFSVSTAHSIADTVACETYVSFFKAELLFFVYLKRCGTLYLWESIDIDRRVLLSRYQIYGDKLETFIGLR